MIVITNTIFLYFSFDETVYVSQNNLSLFLLEYSFNKHKKERKASKDSVWKFLYNFEIMAHCIHMISFIYVQCKITIKILILHFVFFKIFIWNFTSFPLVYILHHCNYTINFHTTNNSLPCMTLIAIESFVKL